MKRCLLKPVSFVLLVAVLAIPATSVQATPLNPLMQLTTEHYPLILAEQMQVDYYGVDHASNTLPNSDTQGLLVLTATVMEFTSDEGATATGAFGSFAISIAVDPLTGEGLSGSLAVTGTQADVNNIANWGQNLPGLDDEDIFYSTNLTDFGSGFDDRFEFIFAQEGTGMLAPDAEPIGVIASAWTIPGMTVPDFDMSGWDNGSGLTAKSHTFYMPYPATLLVLAIAGGLAVVRRRRPHKI